MTGYRGMPEFDTGRGRPHGIDRMSYVGRPYDEVCKFPMFTKDIPHAHKAFEHVQTELLLQSRRQDEVFENLSKLETDLSRVAKLTVEREGLHSAERHQKHVALTSLTRRTEEALVMCESLRRGQEQLIQKVERLEVFADEGERASALVRGLQREVESLQIAVRDKNEATAHVIRRLDAMEQIFNENTQLRQEVAQMRRSNERRDLELAAMQGQIDALTKLVREQLAGEKTVEMPTG